MNLLAIDTSTDRAAVALLTERALHVAAGADGGQRHGRSLVPAIAGLLGEAGLSLADLDALAVGLGPGSYTGLRIGVTAIKTLAYAAAKPVVAFDSLAAVARNAPADALRVSVLADAQRGDVYVADFARATPGEALALEVSTRVEPLARWASRLTEPTLVLGPRLDRLAEPLPPLAYRAEPGLNWPAGAAIIELAAERFGQGLLADVWRLEPLYLRRSAAEDQWDARPPRGAPDQPRPAVS